MALPFEICWFLHLVIWLKMWQTDNVGNEMLFFGGFMRKYAYIMIGGALGAVLRLAVKSISTGQYQERFPINTLIINITGTFILALFLTISLEVLEVGADIRLGISTGFLGAYTTFSTLCKETVMLILNSDYITAVSYLTASTLMGLAAAYLGVVLARKAIGRLADRGEVE